MNTACNQNHCKEENDENHYFASALCYAKPIFAATMTMAPTNVQLEIGPENYFSCFRTNNVTNCASIPMRWAISIYPILSTALNHLRYFSMTPHAFTFLTRFFLPEDIQKDGRLACRT